MKPFKNIDEQIEILRHRNLKFKDVEKAKKYLLYNNYYNVINCYSKFFLDSYEKYFEETDFEDITSVHHFDKEIKSVLFKYIIEAEKTFKSVFAYRYSDYFKKYNYAYLDINNYTLEKKLEISRFIAELSNIITKNINFNKQNSISHYIKKHKNVPLWVLINYMTFGQISKLYRYMPEKLKNLVSKDMSLFLKTNTSNPNALLMADELESFLLNIIELRNIIAHNSKMLGYSCKKNTKYNKFLHQNKISKRNDIFNVFVTLKCFLSHEEFAQLNNSLRKRMEKLKKQININIAIKIFKELGFPSEIEKIEQNM